MTSRQPGISDPFIRFHASGWIISLCLHGSAILLAGLLVAKIGLAPPSSSFQWDVTVVGSQPPATPAQVAPGTQPPATAVIRPAQRNAPAAALRPTPSQAALPTIPATTSSSSATVERNTIEAALTPAHQAPAQLLERAPVVSPPEPHETKDELQTSLHTTSAPVEAPPIPAHCPRWRIRRMQTLLSPQKCQDRHHNRPLSSPPLRLKRHRSFPRAVRLRLYENRIMAGSQGLCSSGLKHSNNIPPRRGCIAWKVG